MKDRDVSNDRHNDGPSGRRLADDLRYWLPIVLSLMTTLIAIGSLYGHIGGRLDLIEWRLMMIENRLTITGPR